MTASIKTTLTATLLAAVAAPSFAGGPVIIEDTEVIADAPRSAINPLLVVALVGAAVLVLGGDDDNSSRYNSKKK